MKSLLQINTNVGWNASGRIVERLAQMAVASGWRSYVAYGRETPGYKPSDLNLIRIGNKYSIARHGLMTRLFDRHGLYSVNATRSLIRTIESIAPDVIHLHNLHGYYLNYPILFEYLKKSGIPVVWTLHDCWPLTGHCAFFDSAGCERWIEGCHSCPLKRQYPKSFFDNSAINYRTKKAAFTGLDGMHIVLVSHWLESVVRKSFLKDYPMSVIYNGIEMPDVQSCDSVRIHHPLIVGAASKWDERKGLSFFLELRNILPENYRIELIGLSLQQIKKLPAGISGVGRIDDSRELYRRLGQADVFVNASSGETLGMLNIEAQAAGTPVVAFDSGGMPETIVPETGLVVPFGDISSLASAIVSIIENPGRFAPGHCRRHASEKFGLLNYLEYMQLYESLAGR